MIGRVILYTWYGAEIGEARVMLNMSGTLTGGEVDLAERAAVKITTHYCGPVYYRYQCGECISTLLIGDTLDLEPGDTITLEPA